MVAIKSKILFLLACVTGAVWLLLAQVTGNIYLLWPCLVCIAVFMAWAAVKGMVIPALLFFLPFAPLLKLRPGAISFYTIALIGVYLIYVVLGSRNINIYHFIPGLCLIALIMVVKTAYGFPLDRSFILFSISLLFAPFLSRELDQKYDFYWLTLFFAFGIILAAITSQYLAIFPTISRYIETWSILNVTRLSGYYGDPNFYSMHITTALSGVLILLLNQPKRSQIITLILTAIALLYCGFLAVSKSFLLVAVLIVLLWVVEFLFRRGKLSAKLMVLLTVTGGVICLLSFTIFTDLVDMMIVRLSRGNSLSDFTTGRIELWGQYIKALNADILLLIFGKGFTNILVNDRGSHNTILQTVYQLGTVGAIGLAAWLVCYIRTLMGGIRIRWSNFTQMFILAIGILGPWMALDLLFFDEFFLFPIYACIGLRYLNMQTMSEDGLIIN